MMFCFARYTVRYRLPNSVRRFCPRRRGSRKVVLATNIAETSLTIEGIRLVVDCAQERVARYDPRTGLTRLITQRISRASMTQRAGRAGRLEPGICLHLLAKEQAERAAAQGEPEMLQSDLSGLLMELLQWGCTDPAQLSWLDRPPTVNLQAAKRLLHMLGALEGDRLSAAGRKWRRSATIRVWRRCWSVPQMTTKRQRQQNWRRFSKSPARWQYRSDGGVFTQSAELAAA